MSSIPNASRGQRDITMIWFILGVLVFWLSAVIFGAASGYLARIYMPFVALIVAATIVGPAMWYFTSTRFRAVIESIGHYRIMLFHIWRIPAALLFFWYGFQGLLPPVFWVLAGIGDLIAGSYALYLAVRPESAKTYWSFHRFGFADFLVAVGTGLTFTLLQDPRMGPIASLPLALIPLFGVGVSGASHLMAFDMLKRGAGFGARLGGG
ncbi:MAG: permease [Rhizobium sp.]|nr:permease [Rhizobium sp.]